MNARLSVSLPIIALATFGISEEPSKWTINANLGLTFISTTTSTQTVNFNASLDNERKGIDSIHFDGGLFQSRQTPVGGGGFQTLSNFWFVGGRYDRNFSDKTSYYVSAGFRRDSPNDLDLRSQFGLGVGHVLHSNDRWSWRLSVGASYLTEKYISGATSKNNFGVEFGSKYSRKMGKKLEINHSLSFIPKIDDLSNYVLVSSLEFGYTIDKNLKLTLSDLIDYSSVPPAGALKQNSTLFFGIGFATKL